MRRRLFIQRGIAGSVALGAGLARTALAGAQPVPRSGDAAGATDRDRQIMRELAAFTRCSFATPHPMPFGAFVVRTASGETVARGGGTGGPALRGHRKWTLRRSRARAGVPAVAKADVAQGGLRTSVAHHPTVRYDRAHSHDS